jgi:hypothetical protein
MRSTLFERTLSKGTRVFHHGSRFKDVDMSKVKEYGPEEVPCFYVSEHGGYGKAFVDKANSQGIKTHTGKKRRDVSHEFWTTRDLKLFDPEDQDDLDQLRLEERYQDQIEDLYQALGRSRDDRDYSSYPNKGNGHVKEDNWAVVQELAAVIRRSGFDGFFTKELGVQTIALFDPSSLTKSESGDRFISEEEIGDDWEFNVGDYSKTKNQVTAWMNGSMTRAQAEEVRSDEIEQNSDNMYSTRKVKIFILARRKGDDEWKIIK